MYCNNISIKKVLMMEKKAGDMSKSLILEAISFKKVN